jgi:hypothetical protein
MGPEAEIPWGIVSFALVVRLVGVLVVLGALGLGIQLSGAIISRLAGSRDTSPPDR